MLLCSLATPVQYVDGANCCRAANGIKALKLTAKCGRRVTSLDAWSIWQTRPSVSWAPSFNAFSFYAFISFFYISCCIPVSQTVFLQREWYLRVYISRDPENAAKFCNLLFWLTVCIAQVICILHSWEAILSICWTKIVVIMAYFTAYIPLFKAATFVAVLTSERDMFFSQRKKLFFWRFGSLFQFKAWMKEWMKKNKEITNNYRSRDRKKDEWVSKYFAILIIHHHHHHMKQSDIGQ